MVNINTLIVEDDDLSVRMLEKAVTRYNSSFLGEKFRLNLIGSASNYSDAVAYLNHPDLVRLVLLDIHLGNVKSGLDIFREFPGRSYIIVSQDNGIWQQIFSSLDRRPNDFVLKLNDDALDIPPTIAGIEKFVNEEKDSFFSNVLEFSGNRILMNPIAIVSKNFIRMREETKTILKDTVVYDFSLSTEDHESSAGSFYFFTNRIVPMKDKRGGLSTLDFEIFKTGDITIKGLVEDFNLDRDRFVQITQSAIANLKFVVKINKRTSCLTVKLRGNREYETGAFEVMFAQLKYSKKYVTPEIEGLIEAKINHKAY